MNYFKPDNRHICTETLDLDNIHSSQTSKTFVISAIDEKYFNLLLQPDDTSYELSLSLFNLSIDKLLNKYNLPKTTDVLIATFDDIFALNILNDLDIDELPLFFLFIDDKLEFSFNGLLTDDSKL